MLPPDHEHTLSTLLTRLVYIVLILHDIKEVRSLRLNRFDLLFENSCDIGNFEVVNFTN